MIFRRRRSGNRSVKRFLPPVTISPLPQSLLERFEARAMTVSLVQALRFIAPLSTRAGVR